MYTRDDIIQGEKFANLADHQYQYYSLRNTRIPLNSRIVYTDTEGVLDLYAQLIMDKREDVRVVLCHNSDKSYGFAENSNKPDWVTVFAVNLQFDMQADVFPLPIGLENDRWFPEIDKIGQILANQGKQVPHNSKILYANFNPATNSNEREHCLAYLRRYYPQITTIKTCTNGQKFDEYVQDIINHYYVVSPDGNGADCHRTWESLYLGRKVILMNRWLLDHFGNKIDSAFLHLDDLKNNSRHHNLNMVKYGTIPYLFFQYWENLIKYYAK